MIRPRIAGLAALLLLTGVPHAESATQPVPLWGYIGLATPRETASDVSSFTHATMPIADAIAAIRKHQDGRVVEIGFARENSAAWYSALVATVDGLHYLRVDPTSGAVSKGDRPDITRADLDAEGLRDLDALGHTNVDLAQAIALAEQASGGKTICAGLEQLSGIPQYYVQTVKDGKIGAWIVDPMTGRTLAPN